jgi:hypothetical protein
LSVKILLGNDEESAVLILKNSALIFFHIPKTGGTTIHSAVEPLLGPGDVAITMCKTRNRRRLRRVFGVSNLLTKHSTPAEVCAALGEQRYSEFRRIAFVRNPFARIYSAWRYIKKRTNSGFVMHQGVTYDMSKLSFEGFLRSPMAGPEGKPAAIPQTHWISGIDEVEFLGRTETLNADLARLGAEMGGPFEKLAHIEEKNVSGDRESWKTMSQDAQAVILEKYAKDFEAFDYPDKIL